MRRRTRTSRIGRVSELPFAAPGYGLSRRPLGTTLTVRVHLPLSLARRARKEIYNYPKPFQLSLVHKTIRQRFLSRLPLLYSSKNVRGSRLAQVTRPRERFVLTPVRIRMPRHLPLVRPSMVRVHQDHIAIHSARQLQRMMSRGEFNRVRYKEDKSNGRRASYGQLDSRGATAFGLVAEARRRNLGVGNIADSALVARAMTGRW